MTDILSEAGFAVSSTATIGYARTLLSNVSDHFDLIVLSSRLGDGDGLEWYVELRADGLAVPVIIVSGNSADLHRAAQLGATAILKKPFTIGYLLERIAEALSPV